MSVVNRFLKCEEEFDTCYVVSHFTDDQNDTVLIDTVTDSGTVLIGDAAAGVVVLTPSDGTVADNDEAYLATPNELFLLASGRPLYGRARVQFTEVAADKFNCAFGFQNAVGANTLIDDGGGPKVSGDCLAIYKKDGGGNYWYVTAYCNGTGTATKTSAAATAATWYDFEITATDTGDGLTMAVTYKIDGVTCKDFTTNLPISHRVTYASATEMSLFLGAKLGAATNNDLFKADFVFGKQKAF